MLLWLSQPLTPIFRSNTCKFSLFMRPFGWPLSVKNPARRQQIVRLSDGDASIIPVGMLDKICSSCYVPLLPGRTCASATIVKRKGARKVQVGPGVWKASAANEGYHCNSCGNDGKIPIVAKNSRRRRKRANARPVTPAPVVSATAVPTPAPLPPPPPPGPLARYVTVWNEESAVWLRECRCCTRCAFSTPPARLGSYQHTSLEEAYGCRPSTETHAQTSDFRHRSRWEEAETRFQVCGDDQRRNEEAKELLRTRQPTLLYVNRNINVKGWFSFASPLNCACILLMLHART